MVRERQRQKELSGRDRDGRREDEESYNTISGLAVLTEEDGL